MQEFILHVWPGFLFHLLLICVFIMSDWSLLLKKESRCCVFNLRRGTRIHVTLCLVVNVCCFRLCHISVCQKYNSDLRNKSQTTLPKSQVQQVHLSCFEILSLTVYFLAYVLFISVSFELLLSLIFSPSLFCSALSRSFSLLLLLFADYRHQRKNNRLHPDVSTPSSRGRVNAR